MGGKGRGGEGKVKKRKRESVPGATISHLHPCSRPPSGGAGALHPAGGLAPDPQLLPPYLQILATLLMPSTKPEVHNAPQRCEKRTEAKYTENVVKFGHNFEICEQIDRHTAYVDRSTMKYEALLGRSNIIFTTELHFDVSFFTVVYFCRISVDIVKQIFSVKRSFTTM